LINLSKKKKDKKFIGKKRKSENVID